MNVIFFDYLDVDLDYLNCMNLFVMEYEKLEFFVCVIGDNIVLDYELMRIVNLLVILFFVDIVFIVKILEYWMLKSVCYMMEGMGILDV